MSTVSSAAQPYTCRRTRHLAARFFHKPYKLAHQFWISYHPPTGAKHTSSGDETPPIPEGELEQQKIEHEKKVQKEKECQAREAEEVRQLDIKLLHQRAIEAEEVQKREIAEAVEELRGMNTSWSHHRLCDLQRQAARFRQSRPSIPDTTKHYRSVLKKACSAQLTKPQSSQSISDNDGIFINLSHLGSCRDESVDSDTCETTCTSRGRGWRASANDVSPQVTVDLSRAPSCPGWKIKLPAPMVYDRGGVWRQTSVGRGVVIRGLL
ncbi:unnamed protein product, partial [Iphiclides podalirius]